MYRRAKSGFTLIEVMVAIAILSLGLVLVLQYFSHSLSVLKSSEDYVRASLLFENKLADIEITLKEGEDIFTGSEIIEDSENTFKLVTDVSSVELKKDTYEEELAYENLYNFSAILSWDEKKRKNKIPVATYLIKYEKEEE